MNKRTLTIGAQLLIGFSVVLAFVVILGAVSGVQTVRLYEREQTLYDHPLQVKEATDQITIDVLDSRVAIRDYILFNDDAVKKQEAQQIIATSFSSIEKQLDKIGELYLGPTEDIERANESFINWKVATQNRMNQAKTGEMQSIIASLGDDGNVGSYRIQFAADIKVIDDFASNKATELNTDYSAYYRSMITSRNVFIGIILGLSALISVYIIESIRRPLAEFITEISHFREGKLDARIGYSRKNEFGKLSASFNSMADAIQMDIQLKTKATGISDAMLRHEDKKTFFRTMLEELAKEFCGNTAAVYLLSADKKTFQCYDSIGLNGEARESFDALLSEGEFGMALATKRPQLICRLQEDAKYRFPTSSGELTPNEIITIPIVSGSDVIAVISLTSVSRFFEHADQLIEIIVPTLSARIEGILAYQTIQDMLARMGQQNRELDAQKNELTAQADELMQQNAVLDMQSSQLAEASRLKTTFLSNMSHELRTPLNSIIALSGVLTRRLSSAIPEEELSYLEIVERNGKHLLSLINDILDISRIEAGREEIEITKFGLADIISDLIQMLTPLARQKGIDLVWITPDIDVRFISDERKCRHILQNIISNAVKFTETGAVTIETLLLGDNVRIKVTDTGIGIAKEHIASIFNEFQQADNSTSRKYGGSGLGLAIAKKYAEFLGGSITVSSTPGVGSEFVITLPISQRGEKPTTKQQNEFMPELPLPKRISGADNVSSSNGKTILIIEDSEPAIIQVKDFVEQNGHKMLVARSAREAYKIVEETVPDAIILDLMMPEIDGFETLNTLRASERTADIPVLILTAKQITSEELSQLTRNHVSQIVQKGGINSSEFLAAVSRMLQPPTEQPEETSVKVETEQPVTATAQETQAGEMPLVLVVEDNADNRTTVRALLMDDFRVIEAEDGEKGVELAKKTKPDLILMDIALPGISGIDAFHAIRNAPSTCHIPIIALTASAMLQERSSILAHGFEAFVAKPIQIDELILSIKEVLYGR